jgi:hypothetical protein
MFRNLKDILEKSFLGLREQKDFQEKWVFLNWTKAVGPEIDQRTSPYKLAGDTLFVFVINSVWASQLASLKEQIKESLNNEITPLKIKEIRFTVRHPLPRKWNFDSPDENLQEPFPLEPLTDNEEKAISEQSSLIDDEELRKRMQSIMTKEKQLRKARERRGWKACPECSALTERGELCPFCRAAEK